MGGITLLYFNDDRPYRKTGISYVFQTIIIRKQKNFTKERERLKRPEGRFWMQREKFWHQTGRYVQSL